jgi:hypothetical protein
VAAEALDGESGDCVALAIIQSDRTADSRVQTAKFGYATLRTRANRSASIKR